jgi:hypothetical protein
MRFSRRNFMKWAATVSSMAVAGSARGEAFPLFNQGGISAPGARPDREFRPDLLPSQEQVWEWETWMAKLGPKFTGNKAHNTYIDFLEQQLKSFGYDVGRDHVKMKLRWEARHSELTVNPANGQSFKARTSSEWPYSGQTPPEGITAELFYAGADPQFDFARMQGKIVLLDCPAPDRAWWHWYAPVWGMYPSDTIYPAAVRPTRSPVTDLTQFLKAGAVGVILAWTNVADDDAADQYTPFSRPLQNIPGVWVGRETGANLRNLALNGGAKVTLVLEADVTNDSPADHLLVTVPGQSEDDIIIVNTHTDGTNGTEENGGVGVLALAKYFSQIPKSERKRTIVFVLASGHMAAPYVHSIFDVIQKHPDLVSRASAALTIEHLGCQQWVEDVAFNYKPTGRPEIGVAYAPLRPQGELMLDALQGSKFGRVAVVAPKDGITGEGGALISAGVPTMGYICMPYYLLAAPANGCIEKLSGELMHGQIEVFAKVLHRLDNMTVAQLKGEEPIRA